MRETTERVKVASHGSQANGESDGPGVRGGISFGPDISDDGRFVTFDSIATNLVAGDTNTCGSTFVEPPGICPDVFRHSPSVIQRNVADQARPASARASKSAAMRTWTAEELRRFLAFAREDPLYPAWLLAATTGMRRGEVLALQWRDIDLAAQFSIIGNRRCR